MTRLLLNRPLGQKLRNNSFPTSLGGKAYDTAVVLSWLQDETAAMESDSWC